jgi:hypothetical protein
MESLAKTKSNFFCTKLRPILTPSPSPKERVARSTFCGLKKTLFVAQACNEKREIASKKTML